MTERYPRATAKIYHFTDRIRMAASRPAKAAAPAPVPAEPLPSAASGSGWYHDAAIRETDPQRKP